MTRLTHFRLLCLVAFSVFLSTALLPTRALAQTTFGTVVGTISDPSGAALPGVEVTLTDLGTGDKRQATTGEDGLYQFVNILPGNYKVDAEKPGFKHFTRQPVVVEVQQSVRIDIPMPLGDVSQNVEVTAQTPLLQTTTSSLGQVVQQRLTNELPLNGRNVFNLVTLAPSVVPQGQSMTNPTGSNPFAWNNYQIGGAFAGESASYLDGAPLNNGYLNLPALIPTQDSIQEFKVQTNNLSSEWGRFAGGVVNLDTKSGTNEFHGTLYEYLRNKLLNANTFFNNRAGIERPAFTQNQFGGNAGGPLVIPHLYDGRNKTFWFFSMEGFRVRQGQSFVLNVPTAAERTGDFSNLRDASGNLIPIYDPNSTFQTGVDANGKPVYARKQISCNGQLNVICPSQLNPTSLALLRLWPAANAQGAPFTNVNNFVTNASVGGNNNQTLGRLDQVISDKQRVFGRFTYWNNLNLPIDPFKNGVCQDRCTESFDVYNGVIDDVYSFAPTLVGDFRASASRFQYDRTNPTQGFDLTSIGWPSFLNAQISPTIRALPLPNVQSMSDGLFGSQGAGSVIVARDNDYDFTPSLTWIKGKHTLKFGGQFHIQQHNYAQTNVASGLFNFDRNFTASSPQSGVGGFGFATYLLGYPAGISQSIPAFAASEQLYGAEYVNDSWQVNDKLTLNLGLRYEQAFPWTERYNRISWFDPTVPNALTQGTSLPAKGQIELVASQLRKDRGQLNFDARQLAPRFGFAYRATQKTVVRGGYGVFWIPTTVIWDLAPNNDNLNSIGTPFVSSINGGLTPFGNFSNPFPNGMLQPPGRDPNFQKTFLGQGINAAIPTQPYAYQQQWNFDIQQELAGGLLFDIAYAGSKGTHLAAGSQNVNQLPDQYLSLGTTLTKSVPNPYYGLVTKGTLAQPTVTYGQLLRPFPEFTGVSLRGSSWGSSIYHSMQVKLEKRFSAGGTLLAAYTWAKLISNMDAVTGWLEGDTGGIAGVQDWNNLRAERSISSDNIPHRLIVSYAVDLPFGRGKHFLGDASGITDKLVSGWGFDGVTTLQSGFPLKFSTSRNLTNSYGGGSRPNVVCADASLSGSPESRLNQWFNTSCFVQPAAFTFGNEARVDSHLRQDWTRNFDVSVFKTVSITERVGLQFRAECFNILNKPQFGPPGTSVGTSNYGVVSSQVNNPRLVQFALKLKF